MTGVLPRAILSYMRRALGQEAVDRCIEMAGMRRAAAELRTAGSWSAADDTLALAEAAASLAGDDDIGRRVGEELMRMSRAGGQDDFYLGAGSIPAALKAITNVGTKMSTGRVLELIEAGDGYAVIAGRYHDPADAHRFWCGTSAGSFGPVAELFGATAVVTEPQCQCRGDDRCIYRMTWSMPTDRKATGNAAEVQASRDRQAMFIDRFEQLHSMAAELANAEQVDAVLARIAERAGLAVEAPRFLLAVRAHDRDQLRVHSTGFSSDVDAFAARLLAGEVAENERTLVADVAAGGHHFGRMVALYPQGATVTDWERRLVRGYARHAAAALQAVSSLEAARRDRDTAEALLELAVALSEVTTRGDMAARLAAAVPLVTACDNSGVWLWDPVARSMTLRAEFPDPPAGDRDALVLLADEIPELLNMVAHPTPFLVRIAEAPAVTRELMTSFGLASCAVVPIRVRGEFLGLVTAGFTADDPTVATSGTADDLLRRLGGLARQAGTALDNSDLLDQIRQQALHDVLTGLANRTLMEDRASQALLSRSRTGQPVSLLFVDLDRFKNVNDTLGHEIGDELIRQAAGRLASCLRATDTLARLGGDEFVALLVGSGPSEARGVAEKLISELRRPFELGGVDVFISCSVGIACSPEHGTDYSTLLRHADSAMYQAKGAGRGTYAVHARGVFSARRDQLELENQLHQAIPGNQLRVLYQPQIDMHTMTVMGVEALVRWQHPTLGLVGPDRFIPLAEESGLIAEIDEWVRATAFSQSRAWRDAGLELRVAVNLSTRVLRDPTLSSHIASLLTRFDLPPGSIELEVTDRVIMDEEDLPAVLMPLHDLGVRLAIDDFGTGSSVLGRLERCPVDTLKIDRSFIQAVRSSVGEAPVVSALLAMAHSLGLDVVAEGVETPEQAGFLRRGGCQYVQGFYFSPAVEADQITRLVRDHPRAATTPKPAELAR